MSLDMVKNLESRFVELVRNSFGNICAAARVYVELTSADEEARERLMSAYGFRPRFLDALERIGKGTLLPEVFVNAPELGRLPISEQRKLLHESVPAIVERPDGAVDELRVSLLTSPPDMRRQLLDGSHIRSPAEQRAWLVAHANRKTRVEKTETLPFRATRKGLDVYRPTAFTWADIRKLMKGVNQ
jgi:hypothetical protein